MRVLAVLILVIFGLILAISGLVYFDTATSHHIAETPARNALVIGFACLVSGGVLIIAGAVLAFILAAFRKPGPPENASASAPSRPAGS